MREIGHHKTDIIGARIWLSINPFVVPPDQFLTPIGS
jgi:hypothetical protein